MNKKPIRVLIVEDSPVATIILKRILDSSPDIEVVGTAQTGIEGLELIPKVDPHVICSDLHMPRMDGLQFTQEVMAKFPKPILVISSSVQAEDTQNVFKLLAAGAVDVFPKPRAGIAANYEAVKQELITKIKVLSGVSVFTLHRRQANREYFRNALNYQTTEVQKLNPHQGLKSPMLTSPPFGLIGTKSNKSLPVTPPSHSSLALQTLRVLTIGASTGGPQALQTILASLPTNFPVPVICVQHISEGFLQGLVDWLGSQCKMPVTIAVAGERPEPGNIYFPPERKHLELDIHGKFLYSGAEPLSGHRPSVTVTFNSLANYYRRSVVGILLTGMGRDGADGMFSIAQAGGITIAQDEASCVVFGMPKEAIALGAAQYILPITEIAPLLLHKLFANRI